MWSEFVFFLPNLSMNSVSTSDQSIIGILQKRGDLTVSELASQMQVTETAVRQRLSRLLAEGWIDREEHRKTRGRPVHKYSVTQAGKRSSARNFSDLAKAVWDEVCLIEDESVRAKVIEGIAKRLAAKYQLEMDRSQSTTENPDLANRVQAIADFFENRGIPAAVDSNQVLPVLQLYGCPYPDLSEADDLICTMEKALFSALTGCSVETHRCDPENGEGCCSFQLEAIPMKS